MAIRIMLSKKLGELRWTQADLSRATGIRPTTISEMYHELVERVNLKHIELICEALSCRPDEILVWEQEQHDRIKNRTGIPKVKE